MTVYDLTMQRLYNQHILASRCRSPQEVVSQLGAMQAQDYPGVLWSIGLRIPGSTVSDVEAAIARREIIRTWPMRGTLHFVAATDTRWMLSLLTPRIIKGETARDRALELTSEIYDQSREIFIRALQGDKQLSRPAMLALLDSKGISTAGQRGYHILKRLAEEGLLCFGPHAGKQPTFALLSEWAPQAKLLPREESLARLAEKYFHSHGPATVADFARWASLNLGDALFGLEASKSSLIREIVNGQDYYLPPTSPIKSGEVAHLLPGFDEYMLGYKDRSGALAELHAHKIVPGGNGMFLPTVVINGQVVGLWKKTATTKTLRINLLPFETFSTKDRSAIQKAARRYGDFLQRPVTVLQ